MRCILPAAVLLGACQPATPRTDGPPNVVLVLLDDMGTGDVGAFGGTDIATPGLDALAVDSARFTQAYAGAAVCSPTRAALLTGQHPLRRGIDFVFGATSERGLPGGAVVLPELLADQGYVTGHVGKWHLGLQRSEYRPTEHGFAHSFTYSSPLAPGRNSYFHQTYTRDELDTENRSGHLTDVLTDEAIRFVREHRHEPFFLNLWHLAPHMPLTPPRRWARRFDDDDAGQYAGLVGHVDEQIARLVDELERLGLTDNTVLIVASDNGPDSHDGRSSSPFRGHKHDVLEGGLRVPLLVRWPGRIPPGDNDSVTATIDLMPTVLDLLDAPVPEEMDGESLAASWLSGERHVRETPLYWQSKTSKSRIYTPVFGLTSGLAVRDGDYKLVYNRGERGLYNVVDDPGEANDLSAAQPATVAGLDWSLRTWRRDTSELHLGVERIDGAAEVAPDVYDFDGSGSVTYAPELLTDIDDGDFTLLLDVEPRALSRRQLLASKAGSWELALEAGGAPSLSIWPADGTEAVVLLSPEPMEADALQAVGFSVFTVPTSTARAQLFLGDAVVAEAFHAFVAGSESPIVLGASPEQAPDARIEAPRFYLTALSEWEMAQPDP